MNSVFGVFTFELEYDRHTVKLRGESQDFIGSYTGKTVFSLLPFESPVVYRFADVQCNPVRLRSPCGSIRI